VIRTDPPGGTEVEAASTIEVFVSTGSEEFPVPTLVGQTLDDARGLLNDAGMEVGTVEQRPNADFAEGTVIDQSPAAGVAVGAGTPVNLVVSSGPELVVVPEVEELSERDAIAALQDLGLRFTTEEEFSSTVASGLVVRSEPAAGTEVQSGDAVLLVVSRGPQPVDVPKLFGLTQAQAEAALTDRGLVMNVSAATQPVLDPGQDGLVVAQVPSVGATVLPGDIVTVTLGEYVPPPTTTTLPPPATTTTPAA